MAVRLEVCVATLGDAEQAARHGADRLELNQQLEVDGLTPPVGLLQDVLNAVDIPVIVMVRPRPGDFVYDDHEFATILADITVALEAGAAGVAVGALTLSDELDIDRIREIARRAADAELVCHRAFDHACDPHRTLDQLIQFGFTRVLTSGQAPTALEGADLIRQLIEHADGAIEILPGAGVRPENLVELIQQTGCDQVHGTFRDPTTGHTDPATVRVARHLLDTLG